jgi:hypothetical protein|tara:strand:- start:831 stop:1082 length:252 start_codon:yes stop_codon:yes gene_type:complete
VTKDNHIIYDHWHAVQQPGTLLRARHTPHTGKLALVLTKSYTERKSVDSSYPPSRYVDLQWCSSGERFQELITNANNCFEIVK